MNRFVKKNQKFVFALAVAGFVAFVLLVFAIYEYVGVVIANDAANECRDKITRLIRKKPSPVISNIPLIKKDMKTYGEASEQLWVSFGHPYKLAADRFIAELLNIKNDDDFDSKKKEFIESYRREVEENPNPGSAYDQFRKKYPKWESATREFIKLARDVSPDAHIDSYADRVALSALGIPYQMQGNADMMQAYMDNCRQKFASLMPKKIYTGANNFGLAPVVTGVYRPEDYPILVKHLDIIGDIAKRIAKSPVEGLSGFIVRNGLPPVGSETSDVVSQSFAQDGALTYSHYTFEVIGTLDSIRDLAARLEDAIKERRVYVIRSIYIYALDPDAAKADSALRPQTTKPVVTDDGESDAPRTRRGRRNRTEQRDSAEAKEQERLEKLREFEAKLPIQQRTGYGETLWGGNRECRAVFDVDYYVHENR